MVWDTARGVVGRDVVRWRTPEGDVLACDEKRAVLNQNIDDVRRALQDAMDEAVMMGCDGQQFRTVARGIVESLTSPYDMPSKRGRGRKQAL